MNVPYFCPILKRIAQSTEILNAQDDAILRKLKNMISTTRFKMKKNERQLLVGIGLNFIIDINALPQKANSHGEGTLK